MKNKYNWNLIQNYYDGGFSVRETVKHFGMNEQSIYKASKRGDIKLRSLSDSMKILFSKNGPNKMGKEARERISIAQSTHNNGGKSKWFEINGIKVQGTWERDFALLLNSKNIQWERGHLFKYEDEGRIKNYTPDFYLPERDLYIELKGYWWGNDRQKMDKVIEQNISKNILIIEKYEDLISFQ